MILKIKEFEAGNDLVKYHLAALNTFNTKALRRLEEQRDP